MAQGQGWAASCSAGTLQGRPSCVPEHRPAGMTRSGAPSGVRPPLHSRSSGLLSSSLVPTGLWPPGEGKTGRTKQAAGRWSGRKVCRAFTSHAVSKGTSRSPDNACFPGPHQFNPPIQVGKPPGVMRPRPSRACRETEGPLGSWKGWRVDGFLPRLTDAREFATGPPSAGNRLPRTPGLQDPAGQEPLVCPGGRTWT